MGDTFSLGTPIIYTVDWPHPKSVFSEGQTLSPNSFPISLCKAVNETNELHHYLIIR